MKKYYKILSIIFSIILSVVVITALVACHIKCDEHTFGEWINISGDETPCESRRYCRMCEACEHLEYKDGTQDDHDFEVETLSLLAVRAATT